MATIENKMVFIRVYTCYTHAYSFLEFSSYLLPIYIYRDSCHASLSLSLSLSLPTQVADLMKTPTLEGYETRRLKDIVKTLANASASSANARQHALPYRS